MPGAVLHALHSLVCMHFTTALSSQYFYPVLSDEKHYLAQKDSVTFLRSQSLSVIQYGFESRSSKPKVTSMPWTRHSQDKVMCCG